MGCGVLEALMKGRFPRSLGWSEREKRMGRREVTFFYFLLQYYKVLCIIYRYWYAWSYSILLACGRIEQPLVIKSG
jgi:hypothetical protein